eukprot:12956762-Alexandrium_andersonii.AAC.1
MIDGQRQLINLYLTGAIGKNDEAAGSAAEATHGRGRRDLAERGAVRYNDKQLYVEARINKR